MHHTEITMLNHMADLDFNESLDQQLEWGIKVLDLKEHIYGKALIDLSDEEAMEAAENIKSRGMSVYCLSTVLFFEDIELGEEVFRKEHLNKLDRILELAQFFKPAVIRLLSAKTSRRQEFINIIPYINKQKPWLIQVYKEAVDKIVQAGFRATMENEANDSIFSRPEEILGFYKALDRYGKITFTFDIQNLWQMGTYPSVEVCESLLYITEYFHLKGSQSLVEGGYTHYASTLEDASWPVIEITKKLIKDGNGIVLCLNPVKGVKKDGYDYDSITKKDLDYIRKEIEEVRYL